MNEEKLVFRLDSFVDAENAEEMRQKLLGAIEGKDSVPLILDLEDTNYISSAGLRAILEVKPKHPLLSIINVRPEIYEIFELTGFTQMLDISMKECTDPDQEGEGAPACKEENTSSDV